MPNTHELTLSGADNLSVNAYYVLKNGRPHVEYVNNNPAGCYAAIIQRNVRFFGKLTIDDKDITLKPEYCKFADAGFVISPSDTDNRESMDDLYETVRDYLTAVIILNSDFAYTAAAAYVVMTWFAYRYDSVPYLRFIGDYGTGKTTALKALANIIYRSLNISSVLTPAALFRTVEAVQGTIMVDEADMKSHGMEAQIIKILNHGYTRGVHVIRMSKNNAPLFFSVFGPKVIATRLEFKDPALESRCLDIKMTPHKIDNLIALTDPKAVKRAGSIRNGLLFQRLNYAGIEAGQSFYSHGSARVPAGLEARVMQLARPLFDCTPLFRQQEIEKYFEAVNIGYKEARYSTPEEQVRRILRKELNRMNHRLTLAQLYGQLSYDCRVKNSSKKIARIAEAFGVERKRTRDGVVLYFRDGIV